VLPFCLTRHRHSTHTRRHITHRSTQCRLSNNEAIINLYSPKKTVATQKHSSASINTHQAKTMTNQTPPPVRCCPLVGQFEYTPFANRLLWLLCANMTSPLQPEIHNISQRGSRVGSCTRTSQASECKLPRQKYFVTSEHKSEYDRLRIVL